MSASTGQTELAAKGCPNTMVVQCLVLHDPFGEVVEWFMALVLKTSVGASPPSVRIRPSPLLSPVDDWAFFMPDRILRAAALLQIGACCGQNVSMRPLDTRNLRCD